MACFFLLFTKISKVLNCSEDGLRKSGERWCEEEQRCNDKGMVHLKVVWEEVEVFFFFQTPDWCQLLTLFLYENMEKVKKNKL